MLLLLVRCSKEEYDSSIKFDGYEKHLNITVPLKGTRDPFAFQNMNRALNKLKALRPELTDLTIKPNHLYLRFLPGNEIQMDLLLKDSSIVLFDHSLDSEDYASPDTSSSGYGPQYCVVPIDRSLPAIPYELLYEVFIPPDEATTKSSSTGSYSFYDELLSVSANLTGNLDSEDTLLQVSRSSGRRWNPSGRIRAWDDLVGDYIPLNHVNVHARWFTHIESSLTDSEGYFSMSSFRYKVNYSIKWENSFFTIRDGNFLQAWYNGPRIKGEWNLDIKGGKSIMFATIHRAAYRHFYGDNLGMVRPFLKAGGRTKICYSDNDGTGKFLGDYSAGGIFPDIKIWGRTNGEYKTTNKIFAVTAHELGHQAHSQYLGNIRFWQTSNIIRESWAEAVEWALANDEYHKLGKEYSSDQALFYNHQIYKHNNWPNIADRDYSPIFIDLIDNINQYVEVGPEHPNDMISEYSISFINSNLLRNSNDISSLKSEVSKNKLEGVDDYKIKELFGLY
ncbi:MAG TPA: hypothetical protein VHO50_00890 [Bacteroidales bacterium]|nr:hypothetical protein [Bacteroidales bacterium]